MVDEGQAAADAAPPSTTRSRRPEEFAALADYDVDDFMSEAASEVEVFSTIHVEVEKYAKSLGLCAKQCGDVHSTMPGFKVEFDDFDASKLLICEPPMMASVEGALVQCLRLMQDRFAVSGTPFLISTEYSGERSIICRKGEEVAMEKKDFKAFRDTATEVAQERALEVRYPDCITSERPSTHCLVRIRRALRHQPECDGGVGGTQ